VFRRTDREFEFGEIPIAVSVGSTTLFLRASETEVGIYQLWADHGQA
jgi:hypothetical protein